MSFSFVSALFLASSIATIVVVDQEVEGLFILHLPGAFPGTYKWPPFPPFPSSRLLADVTAVACDTIVLCEFPVDGRFVEESSVLQGGLGAFKMNPSPCSPPSSICRSAISGPCSCPSLELDELSIPRSRLVVVESGMAFIKAILTIPTAENMSSTRQTTCRLSANARRTSDWRVDSKVGI